MLYERGLDRFPALACAPRTRIHCRIHDLIASSVILAFIGFVAFQLRSIAVAASETSEDSLGRAELPEIRRSSERATPETSHGPPRDLEVCFGSHAGIIIPFDMK